MEIVGQAKKEHLIEFRNDLIELLKMTKSSIERLKSSELPQETISQYISSHEDYILKNKNLLIIVENQLKNEFNHTI